jgi:hypothetical protein
MRLAHLAEAQQSLRNISTCRLLRRNPTFCGLLQNIGEQTTVPLVLLYVLATQICPSPSLRTIVNNAPFTNYRERSRAHRKALALKPRIH